MLDARSGRAIPAAGIEVADGGGRLESDGSGTFRSRGLAPGRYRIVARHFGYAESSTEVEVRNGEVVRVLLELEPVALPLDGVLAVAPARDEPGMLRIDRERLARMGARTAGDAVLALPGVRIVERTPGGAQTPTLRGSGADQVLVLLDGMPLNDPVTGEADLSTIAAASIEEVTLVRGARSARYGPRAQGGAILIRTRTYAQGLEGAAAAGSLGEIGGRFAGGGVVGPGFRWSAGAEAKTLRGDFRYSNPAGAESAAGGVDESEYASSTPGTSHRRVNADMRQLLLRGGAEGDLADGRWTARLGYEGLDRGNPGSSFAPSRTARQGLQRGRASLSWRRDLGAEARGNATSRGADEVSLYSMLQHSVSEDPRPPFGLPYDDATRLHSSGLRAEFSRNPRGSRWSTVGGGVELRRQGVRSDALLDGGGPEDETDGSPSSIRRVDFAVFLRARVRLPGERRTPELSFVGRAHRDGVGAAWQPGHEATLSVPIGSLSLHLAHRSSFSPPTLGDQFFREGVGIVANPGLRPERVPSEWEVGVSGTRAGRRAVASFGAEAYRGDVRDMIVWAPDFRFIWSPRNVDAERSGVEGWGELRLPLPGLRFSGSYSLTRITYGREGSPAGGERGVQLAYRPRHAASAAAEWERGGWRVTVEGRYTGLRYPVPAAINAMDPFWSFDARLSRSWTWSRWTLHPLVRVDRLFDRRDSLIFGFPEPGRTLFLELRAYGP